MNKKIKKELIEINKLLKKQAQVGDLSMLDQIRYGSSSGENPMLSLAKSISVPGSDDLFVKTIKKISDIISFKKKVTDILDRVESLTEGKRGNIIQSPTYVDFAFNRKGLMPKYNYKDVDRVIKT